MCVLTPPSQRERAEKQPLSDRLGRCELSARPGMRGERRKERRNDRWIERGGAIKTEREREGEREYWGLRVFGLIGVQRSAPALPGTDS